MLEGKVRVINPLGLHARAAAQLVKLAGSFKSRILIQWEEKGIFADAKSILSVLTLAARQDTVLSISVEGADAEEAFVAVVKIFQDGFGEI